MTTDDRDLDPPDRRSAADPPPGPRYEICVDGHLGGRWASWFDGMTLTRGRDGTTVIVGPVVDQAALHGVLQKLRDLGIGLRSLTLLGPDTGTEPSTATPTTTPGAPS